MGSTTKETKGRTGIRAASSLKHLHRVITEFRKLDGDISAQVIETFLLVAQKEGIMVHQIADQMDVATATASRHVATLGQWNRYRRPGMGLVELREVLSDRRYKEATLTDKGREFRDRIASLMED